MADALMILLMGFVTAAGLIVAIGAQNAYVLTQGLKQASLALPVTPASERAAWQGACAQRNQTRVYAYTIAFTCICIDVVLISLGVSGMGTLVAGSPGLLLMVTLAGAMFLTVYGAIGLRSAFRDQTLETDSTGYRSRTGAILVTLSLSLLNPHVYLDTVLLIGSVGAKYEASLRWLFILGASLASATWFLGLIYAAGKLAPWFRRPVTWRCLYLLVAVLMWSIALWLWQDAWSLMQDIEQPLFWQGPLI